MTITKFTKIIAFTFCAIFTANFAQSSQKFERDFSPNENILTPAEKSTRSEICLNGLWDFQPVEIPQGFKMGTGTAPDITEPSPNKWESVKIKIPSPWNVNNWGGGQETGEGTVKQFAPSSIYFPSYPKNWIHKRMGWLKKEFDLPQDWKSKRIFLHFDAVAGWADIFVNGKKAGDHFDQHMGFELDITDFVKSGKNELLIGVRHSKLFDKYHQSYKMNATYPAGSNTDDLIGIWQDVFLLARNDVYISDVFVKPLVSKGILEFEVEVKNASKKDVELAVSGAVSKWINLNGQSLKKANEINLDDGKPLGKRLNVVLDAAEPKWTLEKNPVLNVESQALKIKAGETKLVKIQSKDVKNLEFWTPDSPNLYMSNLAIKGVNVNTLFDVKSTRFGWREFSINGDSFMLNGKKIQAFGDLQHPFGPYICSRRFVFGWYQMIKLFGGNAVRPHAQPWPKHYYDMADEMGVMVLAEDALFGSSIRPNLTEDITWERTANQIKSLVKRYRNNPAVIGWSVGNEMFAMSLPHLNKVPAEEKAIWDKKLVELAKIPQELDPTRPFVTIDGDQDMNGGLPVWSKHFGDGDVSGAIDNARKSFMAAKPMIVGEFGATYYGNPLRVYKYWGDEVFYSYEARNEALAGDLYRMVTQTAKSSLAYFSPSEVCWFGVEHLPYGYSDFSKLPSVEDGIFPAKAYEEGKAGYQFERIPPYIFTVNAGIDSSLPFLRPLAHFKAMKAALKGGDVYEVKSVEPRDPKPFKNPKAKELPAAKFASAYAFADSNSKLAKSLAKKGVVLDENLKNANFVIVDGENLSDENSSMLKSKIAELSKQKDSVVLIMIAENDFCQNISQNILKNAKSEKLNGTILKGVENGEISKYFNPVDLYFSERISAEHMQDRYIIKRVITHKLPKNAKREIIASNIDWTLFDAAEKEKCAQTLLYQNFKKPQGVMLATIPNGKGKIVLSSLNYNLQNKQSDLLFKSIFRILGLATQKNLTDIETKAGIHDLLMDGPLD